MHRGLIAIAIACACGASAVYAGPPGGRCALEPMASGPSAPVSAPRAPACHRASAALADALRPEIEKGFVAEHEGGKAAIDFPCDALGARIDRIEIETGGGHGGTLALWRARRRDDGRFDVRGIRYAGASMYRPASPPAAEPYTLVAGVVALSDGDLDRARAAATAAITERDPPPPPDSIGGLTGTFSSRDFHAVLRLVDDAGRAVERRFTGYESNGEQARFLGLELALAELSPITALPDASRAPGAPAPAPADEDRALFADFFTGAAPHFDEDFYWWVKERYVDLARYLGTRAALRGLVTRLAPAKLDRSARDTRAHALDAIARITGWDARAGGRSDADAAASYLAECK